MEKVHEDDDIWYALASNSSETFSEEDIRDICAEVPGENDELHWWWVLKLTDGRFVLVEGWCDYTGWDCQSGITEHGIFTSALKAAKAAPELGEYDNRTIRKNLVAQIKGKQPKFLYVE